MYFIILWTISLMCCENINRASSELSRWPIYQSVTLSFFRRKKLALAGAVCCQKKNGGYLEGNITVFSCDMSFDETRYQTHPRHIEAEQFVFSWLRSSLLQSGLPDPVAGHSLSLEAGREDLSQSGRTVLNTDWLTDCPSEEISGKCPDISSPIRSGLDWDDPQLRVQ